MITRQSDTIFLVSSAETYYILGHGLGVKHRRQHQESGCCDFPPLCRNDELCSNQEREAEDIGNSLKYKDFIPFTRGHYHGFMGWEERS